MKLVLIKKSICTTEVPQKNTQVACTHIFRHFMRLGDGMSAIKFIDSCGH